MTVLLGSLHRMPLEELPDRVVDHRPQVIEQLVDEGHVTVLALTQLLLVPPLGGLGAASPTFN